MEFELSESHRLLREAVKRFCDREIRPFAREWELRGRFPMELVPALASMGLLGIGVPEEFGGAGLDHLGYAICIEELARCDGSIALTVASHNGLALAHLLAVGTAEQKAKFLPRACSGEWLAAWAMTEPGAGSDTTAIRTTARRDGDHWILDGTKTFITQGSICGFCVVLAKTESAANARAGMTAFIVERGTEGFVVSRVLEKYGCRASDTAELCFRSCRVPDSARLGGVGAAFYDTMRILDRGRLAIAAMALGLGRGAFEQALNYSKEREAFGRPIAQHQAVQWKLADGKVSLQAAELLVHRAAWLADRGESFSTEVAMAKLFASEMATRICNDAMQIHGGYGYTREFPIERFLRDARLCEIGEGTSEIMRMLIARQLLGPGALAEKTT
ncbi:MAG: acyl-CoA dehydrogenase family protein [Polyangiaceae bacterium]